MNVDPLDMAIDNDEMYMVIEPGTAFFMSYAYLKDCDFDYLDWDN